MFGALFGDMEARQKEMQEHLATIRIQAEAGEGAVKITANAKRQILNVSINKEALDWEDVEQVEDLIAVAVNRALELAAQKEAEETQQLLQKIMPPGLGDLSDLFGK